ncbi:MAG TPA: hypothetical protein ENJ00_10560, partial [Phycisphaerales bacterium]|nr:hypothetical protein [Phycisphaerales bacterium]
MSIEAQVERIAKAAAMADPTDLPGLVTLGELFSELIEQLDDPSLKSLADQAGTSAELIERIVMHDIDDLESTFEEINKSIEYAQNVVNALQNQQPVDSIPVPGHNTDENNPEIDEELLSAWVSGCTDTLAELEAQTLELESGMNEETLAEIRRGIHTLKGECGVLSLASAQKVCHEAESLIDASTANGGAFPVNEILAVLDWLKEYVSLLESDPYAKAPDHTELMQKLTTSSDTPEAEAGHQQAEPEIEASQTEEETDATEGNAPSDSEPVEFPCNLERDENLDEFLIEAREHIASAEGAVLELESNLTDSELINTVFRAFHTIKGVAGFMNLEPIVHTAHNAEFLLDEARKETITLDSSYLDLILSSCDMILKLLAVLDGEPAPLRCEMDELISRLQSAAKGEVKPSNDSQRKPKHPDPDQLPEPADSVPQPPAPKPATKSQKPPAKKEAEGKKKRTDVTVKVNTERLDNLVTMVGELVIAQQMVVQDPSIEAIEDQRCQRNLSHSGKIIRDLQEVAMSLRMVTLKGLFQKMARLVRDV